MGGFVFLCMVSKSFFVDEKFNHKQSIQAVITIYTRMYTVQVHILMVIKKTILVHKIWAL